MFAVYQDHHYENEKKEGGQACTHKDVKGVLFCHSVGSCEVDIYEDRLTIGGLLERRLIIEGVNLEKWEISIVNYEKVFSIFPFRIY